MVLFPYNNDTFERQPHKRWAFAGSPRVTREGDDMVSTAPAPYYDPYDIEIDTDPYPVWKRLRDEAPLYHNERYEFYALSRHADVQAAQSDPQTYRSGYGHVPELMGDEPLDLPYLVMLDPPRHDMQRVLVSREF